MKYLSCIYQKLRISFWRFMGIPCLLQVQKIFGGMNSLSPDEIEQVKNHCALGLQVDIIVSYVKGCRIIMHLRKALADLGYSESDVEQLITNNRSNAMVGESVDSILKKNSGSKTLKP